MRASFILLACVVSIFTQAGAFKTGSPEQSDVDPKRLSRIDQVVHDAVRSGEIPGAVALVARKGKIVYHRSFGSSDLDRDVAMQKDSIFRIASMTKAVTSVGVMVLYEQGRFRLHDPISKFIPEFKSPKVLVRVTDQGDFVTEPAKREISIRDLLTHTSGIAYPFAGSPLSAAYKEAGIIDGFTAEPLRLADVMRKLATMPLMHHPGEKWTYGLNTDVLGYLIEVVSGQSLDQFFRTAIFEPLKMSDTFFYLPNEKQNRLVTLYKRAEGKLIRVEHIDEFDADPAYPFRGARSYFSGGAGLSSTAYDYARFVQMLLNKGTLDGEKLLSRKSVDLLRASHFEEFGGKAADFGLGFSVVQDIGAMGELGSEGAYSWGGAFYTSFWIDPNEQLIGIFLSQMRPAQTDIAERFRILVYQALE